ncbi:toll/interleukin-1 receptor domain-containing protein [Gloeothece verrucosa]|uniref:TIR protein n=1 Tax=Gloeothece verrucosa (strain PCC 7822) TaxID=497965 RepID=E0UNU9_GLOV7|nr:toll/interleukin-1 receptor domain-containing protein [Gloeothece verrucosa]ADN18629.1 TIR protein [Gloeothece verrucosa PCC 7822]
MKEKSSIQIFLAHASEDKPQVLELYNKLQDEGYKPWIDKEDLLPGQSWPEEIPKAIRNSDIFIACLSSTSVLKRGYIQREFRLALNFMAEMPAGQIYLIPLKLDECEVPDLQQVDYGIALKNIQWLDYWKPNGFERLLRTINNYFS